MRYLIKPILTLVLILMIAGCGGGSNSPGATSPPENPPDSPGNLPKITIIAGNNTSGGTDGLGTAATFLNPMGITIDGSGNLYVTDGKAIRKLTKTADGYYVSKIAGEYSIAGDKDGSGSAARFMDPSDITVDSHGVLYVTDAGNHTIRKLTTSDGVNYEVSVLAGISGQSGSLDKKPDDANATFNTPRGICIIEDGEGPNIDNLFVADQGNGTIRKIILYGSGSINTAVSTIKGLDGKNVSCFPIRIALDNQGNLYVAEFSDIKKLTYTETGYQIDKIAGSVRGFQDGPGFQAKFNSLYDITVDKNGNIYVVDYMDNKIRKLTGSGINYTVSTIAELPMPQGITADKDGNLFVTYSSYVAKISFQ